MYRKLRSSGHVRPSTLRRDGYVEPPPPLPVRDRYSAALAAGWRALG